MSLPYKKVLIIGATSGIGLALAEKLVEEGHSVIVTGRRKENLDTFVEKHGKNKADAVVLDINEIAKIPSLMKDIMSRHQDIDCVILNSGIQRRSDWSDVDSIDISVIQQEWTTNYLAYLALTKELIPFLHKQKSETSLVYVSSNLALVPMPARSNYCASKAALHHWILCLRASLSSTNIKVIEVFPPAVQTELHDERHQPDIKNGRSMGMPIDEFTEATWKGLIDGKDQIPVGVAEKTFQGFEMKRQEMFGDMLKRIQASTSN